jgi:hypothetical protein
VAGGIGQAVSVLGHGGGDGSPLTRILVGSNHVDSVMMAAEDWLRITFWFDGNAAFYGDDSEPRAYDAASWRMHSAVGLSRSTVR